VISETVPNEPHETTLNGPKLPEQTQTVPKLRKYPVSCAELKRKKEVARRMSEDERLEKLYLDLFRTSRKRWKKTLWKVNKQKYGMTPWDEAKKWGRL